MDSATFHRLYEEQIMPYHRQPYHFGKPDAFSEQFQAYNPLCGDKYELYLQRSDRDIHACHFDGFGCALSKASTSIMLEHLEQTQEDQLLRDVKRFLQAIDTGDSAGLPQKLVLLSNLRQFGGRLDCLRLSWVSLRDQLLQNR